MLDGIIDLKTDEYVYYISFAGKDTQYTNSVVAHMLDGKIDEMMSTEMVQGEEIKLVKVPSYEFIETLRSDEKTKFMSYRKKGGGEITPFSFNDLKKYKRK